MKFQLFDDEDLKRLEEALSRAVVRALKVSGLAKFEQPETTGEVGNDARSDHEYMVVEKRGAEIDTQYVQAKGVVEAISVARKKRGWGGIVQNVSIVAKPQFTNASMATSGTPQAKVVEPPPPPPAPVPVPAAPPVDTTPPRRRTDLSTVLKTVGACPIGFIPRDKAVELLGGGDSVNARISKWIIEGEVRAVIAAEVTPPTKGLPGRVVINKQELLARDKLRQRNNELPVHLRKDMNGDSRYSGLHVSST